MKTVDVIIPTCRPDGDFSKLVERLCRQTVLPGNIFVINTEKEWWDAALFDKEKLAATAARRGVHLEVRHIAKEEFDHGGTRDAAAVLSQADILLFMTQDALPADRYLIGRLLDAFGKDEKIAAAYARQLPKEDCGVIERFTRKFNYGEEGCIKSAEDLHRLGIKTYFCSNVCAAYDRLVYKKSGGFIKKTIFNEDMIFAAGLIRNGYRVAYEPQAKVIHSHNYSAAQQFCRNFDMAVSQAQNPQIFEGLRSEGEGIKLVKETAAYLCRIKKASLLPKLVWQSACKYAGYMLGKNYRRLPQKIVEKCSMNKNFWKN